MTIDTTEAVRTLRAFRASLPIDHRDAIGAALLLAAIDANPAGVARALEVLFLEQEVKV